MNRKIIIMIFVLCAPQYIYAISFNASFEGTGNISQNHVIRIAEPFNESQAWPTLSFKPNYFYKIGLGFAFMDMFDIGMFYESMQDQNQKYEGLFKETYPLAGKYLENYMGLIYNEKASKRLQYGKGSATGKYGFEIIDLETGITFKLNPGVYYRIIIGGRYVKYNQRMSVNRGNECVPSGVSGNRPPPCDQVGEPFGTDRQLSQKIDGFGPRFGLSIVAPIKNSNINLIGSFSYSIVYAQKEIYDIFSLVYSEESNIKSKTLMEIHSIGYPRQNIFKAEIEGSIIRHFNIELGVQYEFKLSETIMILMTGGYKYSAHYGALNTYGKSLKYINPNSNLVGNSYGSKDDDFISQGPFLKVGIKF